MSLTFAKGVHAINVEGAILSVKYHAQKKWGAYCDDELIGTGTSKRHATNILGKAFGISDPGTPTKAPKASKPPWIGHSSKGLFVYGLREVCEILKDSRESEELPGVCRPHKGGYFVDPLAAADFWSLLREELPGTTVTCQEGGNKQEITL